MFEFPLTVGRTQMAVKDTAAVGALDKNTYRCRSKLRQYAYNAICVLPWSYVSFLDIKIYF